MKIETHMQAHRIFLSTQPHALQAEMNPSSQHLHTSLIFPCNHKQCTMQTEDSFPSIVAGGAEEQFI